jgi:hypothetical protein
LFVVSTQESNVTLDPTADIIYCQHCGAAWQKASRQVSYYFESITYPIGSLHSPKDISDAGEEITFCPMCFDRTLEIVERSMQQGDDRTVASSDERASTGDADVVHTPDKTTI